MLQRVGAGASFLTLSRLVRNIPSELLQISPNDYAELEVAVSTLELAINGSAKGILPAEHTPIRVLYRVLRSCPDDYPSPSATDPAFITDPNLREVLHRDIGEVERALHNGEWKAATVLAGSVIEALLLWACQSQADLAVVIIAANAVVDAGRLKKTPPSNIERWDLSELVAVTHELGLITASTRDAANLCREYRNLIHPGRAQRVSAECHRGTAYSSVGAMEAIAVDLGKRALT
jgi:hypothetical protein